MDIKQKQNILSQLAEAAVPDTQEGRAAQQALEKEADKIAALLASETNYDLLEGNIELLDSFAYRVYEKTFSIVEVTLTRLRSIELTYGQVPGIREEEIKRFHNKNTLTVRLLNVLKHIRYYLPEKNLRLFLDYTIHENEDVRKEAESCLKAIAGFDLDIFYGNGKERHGLGPQPQEKVLAQLEALSSADRKKYFSGIITLADSLLSPSIGGSTWTYKKVTMRTGAVPAFPAIKEIRKKTLTLLGDIYALAESTKRKRIITSTLKSATQTSHSGRYGDDVWQMILENTLQVLGIYRQIVSSETDMEIIQHIEHMTYWLHHNRDNEAIRNAALEVKGLIDQNPEYQIFKVLIGYEGVFTEWRAPGKTPGEEDKIWENEYKQTENIRNQRMAAFAESITKENFAEWEDRILRYSKIESEDMATFPFFAKFLKHLAKNSPELMLAFLNKYQSKFQRFMVPVFFGVWETPYKNKLRQLMIEWINAGKYLAEVTRLFEYTKDLDLDLLNLVFVQVKKIPDRETVVPPLRHLIAVIAANYDETRKILVNTLFLEVVKELTARGDGNGILHIWFRKEVSKMVADMDAPVLDAVMENLLLTKKLDYQAEQILTSIAAGSPEKVIEFFGKRLASKKEDEPGSGYDAFPFQFYSLQNPLSKIPEKAVDIVSGWYDGSYGLFIYRGGKFLRNIFPDFPEPFEKKLIELVKSGDEKNLSVVLAVLRNYEGNPAIHRVCKELVKALPADSIELKEVAVILESTGVVSGEYGFVEAFDRKKDEVKDWLNDQDEKVRAFAENYRANLDKRIDWEKKRADEDVALQKFKYGADEDS